MPQKRKYGKLTRVSRESKRLWQWREIESSEERSQQLKTNAQKNAQQRANESNDTRSQWLEAKAQRNAQQRANESDNARTQRLEADAQRHAQQRHQIRQLNHHIALISKGHEINVPVHTLGQMNVECQFC